MQRIEQISIFSDLPAFIYHDFDGPRAIPEIDKCALCVFVAGQWIIMSLKCTGQEHIQVEHSEVFEFIQNVQDNPDKWKELVEKGEKGSV